MLASASAAAQPTSAIAVSGRVVDPAGHPIAGATVSVEDRADLHTTTDAAGRYRLAGVPADAMLMIAADGREPAIAIATSETIDDVVLLGLERAQEVIQVSGEAPPEAPGAAKLSRDEVRRLPGTGNDLLRALSALPGVASFPLPLGDSGLVIRGSAPEDSQFLIDGFEVPALYHQVGFRSIVPTEAIDSVDYLPGGFGVEYGRATSGIVALTTRPGAQGASEQFEIASLDGGVLAQGSSGRLRYMLAFRRSTIDLLLPMLLPSDLDLSLTTVPRYYDEQLRVDYALSSRWKLTFSSFGSDDALELYGDRARSPDQRFNDRSRFVRFIASAHYAHGPWTGQLAISAMPQESTVDQGVSQFSNVDRLALDSRAELGRTWHHVGGLADLAWRAGAESTTSRWDLSLALPPQARDGSTAGEAPPDPNDTSNRYHGTVWTPDFAAWTSLTAGLSSKIHATGGVRVDALARTGDVAVEPRGELDVALAPHTTARLSAGSYRRPAEYEEELEHPDLHPERATQVIAGVEHEPRPGLRLQASLYYTDRSHLIARGADGLLRNSGRGTTYGAELLGTYRQGPWFGWLSASLSHSTRIDAPGTTERLFEYDQPVVINAALSWRHGHWQLGARFQLYSGLPFTPVTGSVYDSDRNVYDPMFGPLYSDRAPYHHQLDLRIDRFWKLGPAQMNWFLDVQNVYMNQSTVGYFYSYDYMQRVAFRSLPILPSAGLRGGF